MIALHHVQVACPEGGEAAARRFYGGVLGLEEVDKPPALVARGGVWFRGPGYELHVGVEAPFSPALKAHPGFVVDGLDVVADSVEGAGHQVVWDDDTFPGYRRFHTFDGHGNRVEVMQPIT
jgi:catechol 2,3-dioxygenase-like lactoylglutathione lyase family enzyme